MRAGAPSGKVRSVPRRELVFGFGLAVERAAVLNFREAETVAEFIGGACEAFEFFVARTFEQIELLFAVSEMRKRGAEQTDFAGALPARVKQFAKRGENHGVEIGRFRKSFCVCGGLETGIADGERYGASAEARIAQTFRCFLAEVAERGVKGDGVIGIHAESVIVRNGFRLGVEEKLEGVFAARFAIKRVAPLAERFLKFFERNGGQLTDGGNSPRVQRLLRNFADAGNAAHAERRKKNCFGSGGNAKQAARLGLIAGNFCDEARGSESAGTRKAGGARDFRKQFVRGGERGAVKFFRAAEIEIGFVNGSHFHGGRIFRENYGDAVGPFFVERVAHVEKNRVRTKFRGGAQRHRRVNAKFARFVTACGDNAARIGPAADDYGFAAKVGTIEQFDGNEKRVHIEMKNGSGGARLGGISERTGVLRAELS